MSRVSGRLDVRLACSGLILALSGCAADSPRDHEPFDPRTAALEAPPLPDERTSAELARAAESRRGRLAQGLTLEEAQEIALASNPALLANADAVDAARARITEAGNFTNPIVGAGKADFPLEYGHGNASMIGDTRATHAGDWRDNQTNFSISKDLDVSGKRLARVDGAVEAERQTEAQFVSAARQLRAQVRVAYAQALVSDRNLALAREALAMARKNLEIVGGRAAGGNALPADNLRAEADAARAESDLAQVERDAARARRALAALLGDPEATIGGLRSELPLSRLPADADDDRLRDEALAGNADVIASRRAVRAAEANLRLQQRSMVPDLTASLQYNRYILDRFDTLSFGLSIPLPIFDQNRGQVAEATALLHQAQKQERASELTTIQGVRDDLQVLRASRSRIDRFEKEILPKDRKAVELTENAFQGGKVLYLDVIAARQTFNQARSDYVNELSSYESTLADLERLVGHPLEARPGAP